MESNLADFRKRPDPSPKRPDLGPDRIEPAKNYQKTIKKIVNPSGIPPTECGSHSAKTEVAEIGMTIAFESRKGCEGWPNSAWCGLIFRQDRRNTFSGGPNPNLSWK